jgi:hypothetical protein
VRARHERVGAEGEGVRGEVGVEPEVRTPGRVDDERDVVRVGGARQAGDVTGRADVGGVADEDRNGAGRGGERRGDGVDGDAGGQAGRGVDVGVHPDGREAGEDEAEQHRAVEGAGDDDGVARPAHGEGQGLVAVGGAPGREAAQVHAPGARGPGLRVCQDAPAQLHRVEPGVERHVAGDDVADEVEPVLVTGDGERRRALLVEPQPGIEQGGVTPQTPGVSGHRRLPR